MTKVLVVDDEKHILELIKFNLEREGFTVFTAEDGATALNITHKEKPDLIILDIMLPGMSGYEVCESLSQDISTRDIPIIMLSARVTETDKVHGLEKGADDYVTKPFSPRELVARVKARIRRSQRDEEAEQTGRLVYGRLIIDQDRFAVFIDGTRQDFTPKEFELFRFLVQQPGKVFSREYLLQEVWGYNYVGDSRTVDVHVRHIRQKLEQIPDCPNYIETVRGIGYRFKEM